MTKTRLNGVAFNISNKPREVISRSDQMVKALRLPNLTFPIEERVDSMSRERLPPVHDFCQGPLAQRGQDCV